jgi:hypothetical protein
LTHTFDGKYSNTLLGIDVITFIAAKIGRKNINAMTTNSIKTPLILTGFVKK